MLRRMGRQVGLTSAIAMLTLALLPVRIAQARVPPAESPVASDAAPPADVVDTVQAADDAGEQLSESLSQLGFDRAFFEGFKDNEPLGEEEQGRLAELLAGLPRIDQATLEAARRQVGFEPASRDFANNRGRPFALRFDLHRVTRQDVPKSLRETLGYDSFYLCQGELFKRRIVVAARRIPRDWKLDTPLDHKAGAVGLYIKLLMSDSKLPSNGGAVAARPTPLFAANRVTWHPTTLLAHLGVDYGLFDEVQDRTPLQDREIFFQMLAAADSMAPQYLEHQIKRLIGGLLEKQDRLARIQDLPAKQRAAAQRAVERARDGATDIVPLFDEPAANRGEFVVLRGEAVRATEVPVDDPQFRKRFHIDRYYGVELVTPDSEGRPIMCCLTRLPPEMPLGESIHESVRVAGFFLKTCAFATRRGKAVSADESQQSRAMPLVVGATLMVIPTPKLGIPTQSLTMAGGVLIVISVCAVWMWHVRRTDPRAELQHGTETAAIHRPQPRSVVDKS